MGFREVSEGQTKVSEGLLERTVVEGVLLSSRCSEDDDLFNLGTEHVVGEETGSKDVEWILVPCVERDLEVEEGSSDVLPSTRDELKFDGVPRSRLVRRSEESERVVVEVEGLMKVSENLGEGLVWEAVERVRVKSLQGRRRGISFFGARTWTRTAVDKLNVLVERRD